MSFLRKSTLLNHLDTNHSKPVEKKPLQPFQRYNYSNIANNKIQNNVAYKSKNLIQPSATCTKIKRPNYIMKNRRRIGDICQMPKADLFEYGSEIAFSDCASSTTRVTCNKNENDVFKKDSAKSLLNDWISETSSSKSAKSVMSDFSLFSIEKLKTTNTKISKKRPSTLMPTGVIDLVASSVYCQLIGEDKNLNYMTIRPSNIPKKIVTSVLPNFNDMVEVCGEPPTKIVVKELDVNKPFRLD